MNRAVMLRDPFGAMDDPVLVRCGGGCSPSRYRAGLPTSPQEQPMYSPPIYRRKLSSSQSFWFGSVKCPLFGYVHDEALSEEPRYHGEASADCADCGRTFTEEQWAWAAESE